MAAKTYQIDNAHSHAQFKVRHMMISNVRGEFSKITGSVVFDTDDPSLSQIAADIDVSTINTREPQRDEHLKSGDFFDVARYPTIAFVSQGIVSTGPGTYEVVGDLTIHGTTRQIEMVVEDVTPETKDPWGNFRFGASAKTHIRRKDFGLQWNMALEAGGFMVGEEVEITIDVELVRPAS
jgi:polyisoprenoid-binding protein YceI